jgi:hypothetical protein
VEVANVLAVAEATSDDGPPYRINEGRWLIHDPEGTYKPPKDNQGYDFCAPQGETANAMGPVVVAGDKDKIRTMPLEEGDFVGEVDPARINVLVAFSNFGSPEEVEAQYQNISAVLEKAFNFLPVNFSGLLKEVPVGAGTRNLYGERWVYAPHLEEAGELMKRVGRYDAMVVVVNSGEDKTTEGRPAGAAFLGDAADSRSYAVVVTGDKQAHIYILVHELGHVLGYLGITDPAVNQPRTALRDGVVGKTRTSEAGFRNNPVMVLGDPSDWVAEAINATGTKLVPSGVRCGEHELVTPSDPVSVMRDWLDNLQLAEVINAGGMVFARVEAFALQELWTKYTQRNHTCSKAIINLQCKGFGQTL